ncbi:MAG: hypothetical protein O3B24_02020 [Verrucomicrobia bacterium]|nr:hypothetical protein [Verrucomicrobiota bacterium]
MSAPAPEDRPGLRASLRNATRAWFELTVEEQRAVGLIIGLLLLGIVVRYWHIYLR